MSRNAPQLRQAEEITPQGRRQIPSRNSGGPDRAGLAELMTTTAALDRAFSVSQACFAPFPCGNH
jgi:hypothetical protein